MEKERYLSQVLWFTHFCQAGEIPYNQRPRFLLSFQLQHVLKPKTSIPSPKPKAPLRPLTLAGCCTVSHILSDDQKTCRRSSGRALGPSSLHLSTGGHKHAWQQLREKEEQEKTWMPRQERGQTLHSHCLINRFPQPVPKQIWMVLVEWKRCNHASLNPKAWNWVTFGHSK